VRIQRPAEGKVGGVLGERVEGGGSERRRRIVQRLTMNRIRADTNNTDRQTDRQTSVRYQD
jgi:hypothetical protein